MPSCLPTKSTLTQMLVEARGHGSWERYTDGGQCFSLKINEVGWAGSAKASPEIMGIRVALSFRQEHRFSDPAGVSTMALAMLTLGIVVLLVIVVGVHVIWGERRA